MDFQPAFMDMECGWWKKKEEKSSFWHKQQSSYIRERLTTFKLNKRMEDHNRWLEWYNWRMVDKNKY